MHVVVFSRLVGGECAIALSKEAKVHNVNPQQVFLKSLVKGLSLFLDSVKIVSLRPVSRRTNKSFWFSRSTENENGIKYIYLPFLNVKFIREATQIYMLKKELKTLLNEHKTDNLTFITDGLIGHISTTVTTFAHRHKIKVITILTDSPLLTDLVVSKNIFRRWFNYLYSIITTNNLKKFDGFVLLTEKMNLKFNKNHKPHIVIEGICDSSQKSKTSISFNKEFTIVYSGALYEKYGIGNLVDAVYNLGSNYKLILYGSGDYVSKIATQRVPFNNIIYGGLIDVDKLPNYLIQADLLVNPRPNDKEFTHYSFPSKTIQYMASGVATLTTRLSGIPEEYYEHLFVVDTNSVETLEKSIRDISLLSSEYLFTFGKSAEKFVKCNKSEKEQGKRIYQFLLSI